MRSTLSDLKLGSLQTNSIRAKYALEVLQPKAASCDGRIASPFCVSVWSNYGIER